MRHLYLEHWDNSYETMPYPPAVGKYAVYTTKEIIDHVNFAIESVSYVLWKRLGRERNGFEYVYFLVEMWYKQVNWTIIIVIVCIERLKTFSLYLHR